MAEEFIVQVGSREITVEVLSPAQLAASPALLLTIAGDKTNALHTAPYSIVPQLFLDAGHRVVGFDMPNHGSRVDDYGSGIVGVYNAFVKGDDRFAMFVADGMAVINHCVQAGLAQPGRIVVDGTSRGGYMALRLMAADTRIVAGAAHAPVTDWRVLTEFAASRDRDDVAALRLHTYVDALAGRPVHMGIGYHDQRVSTASCLRLYLDLLEANIRAGQPDTPVSCFCTPDVGHTFGDEWHRRGGEFLLRQLG